MENTNIIYFIASLHCFILIHIWDNVDMHCTCTFMGYVTEIKEDMIGAKVIYLASNRMAKFQSPVITCSFFFSDTYNRHPWWTSDLCYTLTVAMPYAISSTTGTIYKGTQLYSNSKHSWNHHMWYSLNKIPINYVIDCNHRPLVPSPLSIYPQVNKQIVHLFPAVISVCH